MAIVPQQRTAENDEPARRNCNRLVQACQTDRATPELLAIQTETEQRASIMSASHGPLSAQPSNSALEPFRMTSARAAVDEG